MKMYSLKKLLEIKDKYDYQYLSVSMIGVNTCVVHISDNYSRSPYPFLLTSVPLKYSFVKRKLNLS